MQLSPFKLERFFAKYEFNTEFLLCSSDCESVSIADLLAMEEGAAGKFQNVWLGYTESLGSPTLRKEISGMYSTTQPEDVLVFTGANEAIYLFMMAALKENDHIIVHAPHYQALSEVAKGIGCMVSPWRAREENAWGLDMDELRHLMRPSTKAIIVNLPHNPTGYLMPRSDFDDLNKFVQENGLLLFSDEVYRESEYDLADRLPAAVDYGPHAVSLGVTSKTYGLAGLRIGWIATKNRDLYSKISSLKDYTTICNSAPSEFLAELAMRNRTKLAERNLQIIKNNLTVMDEFFARNSSLFTWHRPKAGSMGFPKLLTGDIETFCDDLVKKAGVLLLPGSMYDETNNHFRLGLGRKNLPQAVERLEDYLSTSSIYNRKK
ncbi:MAG: aminotransferase class I/II-fold pyridoxal phosphate-dependent enzyme [Anaerolineales bacterium]|uniref:aminotransferase class I/II-fold pyridoxal phosphate-dependent enzyme n=1 Tax=Candidatus Villigracilis vicinus TaxID=3140679 RepID=UPI00313719B1|nr:aminotransferase class I/II-fold pyridoxal phosphate-dependent enzyme [Anaerolineales bacterium]MBK9782555.1 aminotransferase class I/II-fold pyridoxal phosphate-dependent enzyme [Anaerolineales bacterium]